MKRKVKTNPITAVILVAVLVISAILIYNGLINPKIKNIDVSLTAAAQSRMQKDGMTKTEFIRLSGLINRNYLENKKFFESAKSRIDGAGYYILEDVLMTGNKSLTLVIDAREPLAVIATGGKYVAIDGERHVLNVSMDRPEGLIQINGVSLKNPKNGQVANEATDYLDDALAVASVIRKNNYAGVFTEISMRENKEVFLKTAVSVPVIINLRYDVLSSLDIAKSMLDKGITEGQIVVAGDYGYSIPDNQSETYIRGM